MEIRQATQKDVVLLSTMCAEVQQLHAENEPKRFKTPSGPLFAVDFFEDFLSGSENRIFIVEDNDVSMGYVATKWSRWDENPFTYASRSVHIDQIGVLAAHRGKGCGRALIDFLRRLAELENVSTITLNTWHFNSNAQAFFSAQGFETYTLNMWMKLNPENS